MTPTQYRMARAALGWTTRQVSAAAGITVSSVNAFETGAQDPRDARSAIQSALEDKGIVFVEDDGNGAGVRFKGATLASLDHAKPTGPATDAIERMEADIAADRGKR